MEAVRNAVFTTKRFVRFCLAGATNTATDFGVFNILTFIFSLSTSLEMYIVFRAIAFILATANSYYWNKLFVFQNQPVSEHHQIKFVAISIGGLIIGTMLFALSFFMLDNSHISTNALLMTNIALIISIVGSLLWNYFGYSYLVFSPQLHQK